MPTFEERFWEKYKRVPGLHDYNAELAAKDRMIEKLRNALMDVLAIDNFMALDTVKYDGQSIRERVKAALEGKK